MKDYGKLMMEARRAGRREEWFALMNEALNAYSEQICQAVMPLSDATAPIAAMLLRRYADAIEEIDPRIKEQADNLAKLDFMKIMGVTRSGGI